LGDFIMSIPAFVQLRARFPDARITLLTMHSQSADQAEKVRAYAGGERAAPWIELIRDQALDDVRVLPPVRDLPTLREARRVMAEVGPDLVVQMFEPSTPYVRRAAKLALMFVLCGPVRQIGWRQPGQIRPGMPPAIDPHLGHHVFGPLQFLRELEGNRELSDADVIFDVRPGAAAEAGAEQWLDDQSLTDSRLIAVAPGAIHDHKQWPPEKFAELIRLLAAHHPDAHFLIMGTGKDAALGSDLAAIDPLRIHDLCGKSSIAQSAAIFRRCTLVVGNDGGAMHLADAVGTAVVSIVPGLEFPCSVEPWHNQDRAIRHPVSCAPCYSFTSCPEGHRRCMLDLPLTPVLAQCLRAL
jgi:heptosyltransferase-2